jgi:tungstate transport system permease protein
MILGGNIAGYTRVLTTAIALEATKGDFAIPLALGIVLLCVALVIAVTVNVVQQRR